MLNIKCLVHRVDPAGRHYQVEPQNKNSSTCKDNCIQKKTCFFCNHNTSGAAAENTMRTESLIHVKCFLMSKQEFLTRGSRKEHQEAKVIHIEVSWHHGLIMEAVEIVKRAQTAMNRDEGAFLLSYTWGYILQQWQDGRRQSRQSLTLPQWQSAVYTHHTWPPGDDSDSNTVYSASDSKRTKKLLAL